MKQWLWVMVLIQVAMCVSASGPEAVPEKPVFSAFWDNGLRFETADKALRFEIFGRLDNDWAWFTYGDDFEDKDMVVSGNEFRRARLGVGGNIYENVGFKIEYDFAAGNASFKDIYVDIKNLPLLGTLRMGHFYEPVFMDEMVSTNHQMFLESPISGLFAPKRNSGLAIMNQTENKRMTWAAGWFRDSGDIGESKDMGESGGSNVSARITGLPWNPANNKLIHLGVSYSMQSPAAQEINLSVRPEIHLSDPALKFSDSSSPLENIHVGNAEFAMLYGPLTIQGEYTMADYELEDDSTRSFSGFYAQAGVMLTGDSRSYNKTTALFGVVKPKNIFSTKNGGWGAWELAARYSYIDLDDDDVADKGGELSDITLGLNWYLNPNTKFMLDYIHADSDTQDPAFGDGTTDAVALRLHIDF